MPRSASILLPWALFFTTACRSQDQEAPQPSDEAASIGAIHIRDHVVHLLPGQRFAIDDADGHRLANDLTKQQLADRFPELHKQIDAVLDADFSRHHPRPRYDASRSERRRR